MRKLSVSTLVTLDGVVQDPGGFGETPHGGWSGPFFNDEAVQHAYGHLMASDAFLLGRETYELFKEYWQQVHEGEYAARMNSIPKFVASTTLSEPLGVEREPDRRRRRRGGRQAQAAARGMRSSCTAAPR